MLCFNARNVLHWSIGRYVILLMKSVTCTKLGPLTRRVSSSTNSIWSANISKSADGPQVIMVLDCSTRTQSWGTRRNWSALTPLNFRNICSPSRSNAVSWVYEDWNSPLGWCSDSSFGGSGGLHLPMSR